MFEHRARLRARPPHPCPLPHCVGGEGGGGGGGGDYVRIPIQRLAHAVDLPLPDLPGRILRALVCWPQLNLTSNSRLARALAVPCGIAFAVLPEGFEAQVRPRSGMALHHGITVLNAPGTIDSDYRGEVKAILINLGDAPFRIFARNENPSKLVIARYERRRISRSGRTPRQKHSRRRRLRVHTGFTGELKRA